MTEGTVVEDGQVTVNLSPSARMGRVKYVAYNEVGYVQDSTQDDLAYNPDSVTLGDPGSVIAGEEAVFSCPSESSFPAPSLMWTLDGQDVTRDPEQELLETGEDLYEEDTDDSESVLSKEFKVMDTAAYNKLSMEVDTLHPKTCLSVSLLDTIYLILLEEEVNMRMDQTASADNLMVLLSLFSQAGVSLPGERVHYSCSASNYLPRILRGFQPAMCYQKCQMLKITDDVIHVYFVVEMMETWNKLDCFIVVSGALEYALDVEKVNLSTTRTVPMLRPLRAINRIPGMRILGMLSLVTLPMPGNVLLLRFFVFCIFGIVGVQLLAGLLRQRCYIREVYQRKLLGRERFRNIPNLYYKLVEEDLMPDDICSAPRT